MLDIIQEAAKSTISTMSTVFLMLFLTGIMAEMGLFHKMAFIAEPLASASHLPTISASSFVVSIGSKLAANAMTARLKEEGHLTERQAFLSALLNTVPVYFREMFTYQLAYVIPVLGLIVGGAYAVIFSATGIIKLIIIVMLGRRFLDRDLAKPAEAIKIAPKRSIMQAAKSSLAGEMPMFIRMTVIFFLTTFLIIYLNKNGALESMNVLPLAHLFHVPPETIVPLTVFVASPKAGMSILGPMIQSGSLSEVKALMVLMLGSMFMLPFIAIRSEIPNHASLFGMRMGLSLVATSTAISMLVRLTALCLLMIMN
ncbi:MAG: Nucleoside recognition [Methanosaeta sp. PtaU1.Bin112]|nr:MAG: Nucleoside recognition [Methanosaeta sp. PtaU1.Bin112]